MVISSSTHNVLDGIDDRVEVWNNVKIVYRRISGKTYYTTRSAGDSTQKLSVVVKDLLQFVSKKKKKRKKEMTKPEVRALRLTARKLHNHRERDNVGG